MGDGGGPAGCFQLGSHGQGGRRQCRAQDHCLCRGLTASAVNATNLLASYTQFVQALASRYPNQLAAVEVWNEPWYDKFPNTTNLDMFVAFYLQLIAQARQVVKAINPSIQVIGPCGRALNKVSR